MIEKLIPVYEEFEEVASEGQTMTFAPRAIELQEAARDRIEAFSIELAEKKHAAVQAGEEREANELLLLITSLTIVAAELSMWICIKSGKGEAAWTHLIEAQNACNAAYNLRCRLFGDESAEQLGNIADKLALFERFVFPPQIFMSPGGVVTSSECSICGTQYETCPHIRGRAYMGEFCYRIISRFDVREVSFVPDPSNKLCRAVSYESSEGIRNRMTWKIEERTEGDEHL